MSRMSPRLWRSLHRILVAGRSIVICGSGIVVADRAMGGIA
jgi:hypothetical protein